MKLGQNIKIDNIKNYAIHALFFCDLILLAATIGLMFTLPHDSVNSFFSFDEKSGWIITTGATVLIIFNFIFIIATLIFYSYYRKLNLSFSWIFNSATIILITMIFVFLVLALCSRPYEKNINSYSLIFLSTKQYTSAAIAIMTIGIIAIAAGICLYATDWLLKLIKHLKNK